MLVKKKIIMAGIEQKKQNGFAGCFPCSIVFLCLLIFVSRSSHAQAAKWDYVNHPVTVTENKPSPSHDLGQEVKSAFDGYGAQGEKPAAVRAWQQNVAPTPESPIAVEVDYGKPVGVSCFIHYFYVPGSRDLKFASAPSAFKAIRIASKNNGGDWTEAAVLKDLPVQCPQILTVNSSKPAQYWRIEVLELADGAKMLRSYEIETWTGGIPQIEAWKDPGPNLPFEFNQRMLKHKPAAKILSCQTTFSKNNNALEVTFQGQQRITGMLEIAEMFVKDQKTFVFEKHSNDTWRTTLSDGDILLNVNRTPMGLLLNLSFQARRDNPAKYLHVSTQLSSPQVDLYYIPAYVWSTGQPADSLPAAANLQTRMAAMGIKDASLMFIPGTDRGYLGFSQGRIRNELLLGTEPTPILITAIHGDWWSAYQFAVTDVYDFREQPQTVPVSEIQYGISRYLLREDIWEPTLGTLKSWPARDPHTSIFGGFDCFGFYGTTYSIPAYWARYVLNGDPLALERCRSIAQWMCKSGVRVHDGPAKGAFFSSQRFYDHKPVTMDAQGRSQAGKPVLTSQASGAALWTLLFYRRTTGDRTEEINQVIDEAAAWLVKTQHPDGGWPYGHNPDGTKVAKAAPSSGSIWNIWALWRLGKETQNKEYLAAADNGKNWFRESFVKNHHYHGYWEDVGPKSREGYDAAIAAVAFGDMGEKDLVIETAKDAMQWVFTRQIECREANCSAGLVAEQTGWPPASYCNPMMGLAAWTAWRASGDDFWKPFARIPKAIGWWYQPETGAMVWIVDSTQMAPVVGPSFESWWSDWCIGQVGTLSLRWLVRETNLRSNGEIAIDEELLTGKAIGKNVKLWAPLGGLHPILPPHGQVNWLAFRGDDTLMIALMNDGGGGEISCPLDSRDVQGAALCPKRIHYWDHSKIHHKDWTGEFPVKIQKDEMIVLEWAIKP
jgi:hypothetical protein